MKPTLGWVILTMGDRPELLQSSIQSIFDQSDHADRVVVVSNGGGVLDLPAAVELVVLEENLGIPEGRNRGAAVVGTDVVFFLDDDAAITSPDFAVAIMELFAGDPRLSIVSTRVVDPATGDTARRHVPRIGKGRPGISGDVTSFLGGASAIRTSTLRECGRLAGQFFYSHEESDFAWRVLDAGYRIEYRADLVLHHPAPDPSRHDRAGFRSMRNRVWLARRRLPVLIAIPHISIWVTRSLLGCRSLSELGDLTRGLATGFRESAGGRHPIRWSTAWRMLRLGRPPIV